MSQGTCRITEQPIDAAALLAEATSPGDGAALLFVGVVRNRNEGRSVGSLGYQAYAPMAEAVLRAIVDEARGRWETGAVSVVPRVGELGGGEASVAIAVAAPHRGDAYEASRYVIEELKKRVPIWKREGYLDGASEWLPGHAPTSGGAGRDDDA